MAEIITMPRLSDTMEEGVIAAWHAKVGDNVGSGDLLAEIESDKATLDFDSPADGVLLYVGVKEGEGIPVGSLLAIVGDKGEDVSEAIANFATESAPQEEAAPVAEAPAAPPVQEAAPVVTPAAPVSAPAPVVADSAPVVTPDGRIKASPLAKAMARDKGIDLTLVQGSGDHGRIVKRDIESFKMPEAAPVSAPAATEDAPVFIPSVVGQESFEQVRISQMRKTIAKRLSESKFTAPHFYLTMEINMGKAVEARKALNELSPVKISFNDMILKAAAVCLKKHPKVNSAWMEDHIRVNHHVHVGMAVAVDEGLLVPVVRFADQKGLSAIAAETKSLAGKARNKELQPDEWAGNTFTISNLGMYGIEEFTAIINPPDGCIMAIGGIIDKPIVVDGEIVPGKMMKVTMSCDHRVVDGATGSEFLVSLKQMLEDPMRMLL
ncbi:MAG: pyruvate dehydrogenase complex dihydrolipoamide acetyltransferase [Bacteroidota bacterium]